MSTSYGTITITDTTDLGQLSVYLTGSTVRQQIYDSNTTPVSFYPDWSAQGNALIIEPHVYFNGQSQPLSSNKISVVWSKEEDGHTYGKDTEHGDVFPTSPTTTACPESAVDQASGYKKLQRPANLTINGTGATYTATIKYYPIDADRTVVIQGIATLDLTISNNGENGAEGAPAKLLQLIGTGTYFTYHYDGNLFGSQTITLTAEKNSSVSGVHWYCKKASANSYTPIKVINSSPSTDTEDAGWAAAPYYTGDSLTFAGKALQDQLDILDLIPQFINDRGAQFKIVEIDSNGTEVNNGMEDFISIYALVEAAPGQSTYSAYLSNDEETIVEHDGVPILDNAETQFYVSKGGTDDRDHWHIVVTDSVATAADFVYTVSNSQDTAGSSTYLNKYGPDKVKVTTMNVDAATVTFTATHGSYNDSTFTPDQEAADIIKTFSLTKSGSMTYHYLVLSGINANKDQSGTFDPSTIDVDGRQMTAGASTPSSYQDAGVIHAIVHYSDNSTTTLANANNSSLTLNLNTLSASKTIVYIDTFLGGTAAQSYTDAEDKQRITITSDGSDGAPGTSPWNFMIDNQFDGISTDFSNKTSQAYVIKIGVEAAQGTTEKTIYYNSAQDYPTILGDALTYTTAGGTSATIAAQYFSGNTQVTTSGAVDNIRYSIPQGTNIGETGSITLRLTYGEDIGQVLTQTYTYKAQPEALKPIRVLLNPQPTKTFENQEGTITVTPVVMSGTSEVTVGNWGSPTWKVYVDGQWKTLSQAAITGVSENSSTHVLSVNGAAVEGVLGFSFTVTITKGGVTETYTEYIELNDIDDPLQVALHSTVGEQIVNGQGEGVLYARVIRRGDDEDRDTIVPDNMLEVGTSAPTSATASGKTGYFYVVLSGSPAKPTGEIRYYWRSSGSGEWSGPRSTQTYHYTWTFRDSDNAPYVASAQDTPAPITYAMTHDTQFVYIGASTVNNKITAVVKVETGNSGS